MVSPLHGMIVFSAKESDTAEATGALPAAPQIPQQLLALLRARLRREACLRPAQEAIVQARQGSLVAVFPDGSTYYMDTETLYPFPPPWVTSAVTAAATQGADGEEKRSFGGKRKAKRKKQKTMPWRRGEGPQTEPTEDTPRPPPPPYECWLQLLTAKWRSTRTAESGGDAEAPLRRVVVVVLRAEDFLCGESLPMTPSFFCLAPLLLPLRTQQEVARGEGAGGSDSAPVAALRGFPLAAEWLPLFPVDDETTTACPAAVVSSAFLLHSLYFHRWCNPSDFRLCHPPLCHGAECSNSSRGGRCGGAQAPLSLLLERACRVVELDTDVQAQWRAARAATAKGKLKGCRAVSPPGSPAPWHAAFSDGAHVENDDEEEGLFRDACRPGEAGTAGGCSALPEALSEALRISCAPPWASPALAGRCACETALRWFDCYFLAREANARRRDTTLPSSADGGEDEEVEGEEDLSLQMQCNAQRRLQIRAAARAECERSVPRRVALSGPSAAAAPALVARRQAKLRQRLYDKQRAQLCSTDGEDGVLAPVPAVTTTAAATVLQSVREWQQLNAAGRSAASGAPQGARRRARCDTVGGGCRAAERGEDDGQEEDDDNARYSLHWLSALLEQPALPIHACVADGEEEEGLGERGGGIVEESCELADMTQVCCLARFLSLPVQPDAGRIRSSSLLRGSPFPVLPHNAIAKRLRRTFERLLLQPEDSKRHRREQPSECLGGERGPTTEPHVTTEEPRADEASGAAHVDRADCAAATASSLGHRQWQQYRRQQLVFFAVGRHRGDIARVLRLCQRIATNTSSASTVLPTAREGKEGEEEAACTSLPDSSCPSVSPPAPPALVLDLLRQLWQSVADSVNRALEREDEMDCCSDDDYDSSSSVGGAGADVAMAQTRKPAATTNTEITEEGGVQGSPFPQLPPLSPSTAKAAPMTAAEAMSLYMQLQCAADPAATTDSSSGEDAVEKGLADLSFTAAMRGWQRTTWLSAPSALPHMQRHLLFLLSYGAYTLPTSQAPRQNGEARGTSVQCPPLLQLLDSFQTRRMAKETAKKTTTTTGRRKGKTVSPRCRTAEGPPRATQPAPLFLLRELAALTALDVQRAQLEELLAATHKCMWSRVGAVQQSLLGTQNTQRRREDEGQAPHFAQ